MLRAGADQRHKAPFLFMEETFQDQECIIVLTDSFRNKMEAITEHLLFIINVYMSVEKLSCVPKL